MDGKGSLTRSRRGGEEHDMSATKRPRTTAGDGGSAPGRRPTGPYISIGQIRRKLSGLDIEVDDDTERPEGTAGSSCYLGRVEGYMSEARSRIA